MDIIHQPRKGPPKRSGWENQKETNDEYREGWDRIFKKEPGQCVSNATEQKILSDPSGRKT